MKKGFPRCGRHVVKPGMHPVALRAMASCRRSGEMQIRIRELYCAACYLE
jgi:hypothetical protein